MCPFQPRGKILTIAAGGISSRNRRRKGFAARILHMSWADLYAGSSIEGKKMILRQLIERVNIGRNFEIEVEFKISVTQFFDFLHPEGDKSVYYRAS